MNYKRQVSWIVGSTFLLPIIILLFAKYVSFTYRTDSLLESIFIIFIAILISTLPLLFLKEKVYKAWRAFVLWGIPLSLLWIFLTPIHGSGGILATGREYITFLVSSLFLTISYILIAYKAWKYRN